MLITKQKSSNTFLIYCICNAFPDPQSALYSKKETHLINYQVTHGPDADITNTTVARAFHLQLELYSVSITEALQIAR